MNCYSLLGSELCGFRVRMASEDDDNNVILRMDCDKCGYINNKKVRGGRINSVLCKGCGKKFYIIAPVVDDRISDMDVLTKNEYNKLRQECILSGSLDLYNFILKSKNMVE